MSDFLTEEEQVAQLKSWWAENGTTIVVGIVVAVVALGGWRWYDGYSIGQAEAASALYESYREANDDEQLALAERMANEHGGSSYHGFVLLLKGVWGK